MSVRYPVSVTGLGVVNVQMSLLPQARRVNMIPSPVDSKIEYPESIVSEGRFHQYQTLELTQLF